MNRRVTKTGVHSVDRNCSGSALLVVLIMLGTIAVLAAVVARSVSIAAIEMSTARATDMSEADLHAGIELGAAAILQLGDTMRSADVAAELVKRRITVRVRNGRARIDLNQVPESILTALFAAHGVSDDDAASLAAAISDWRGGSASQKLVALPQAEGFTAQLPGLTSFSSPTGNAQAIPQQSIGIRYFFHPTQLVSIPGFSKELVRSILPYVTVASGSKQIDPYIAPRAVLEALPGTTPGQVQAFIESRSGNSARDMALLMLGADKEFITDAAAPGWRLEITYVSAGRPLQREVVIVVTKDENPPYRVLYVEDPYAVASNE